MKFLLVNYEYPPVGGGAATATYSIAHNLSALGHEVTVLTASYKALPRIFMEGRVAVRRVRSFRKLNDRSTIFEMLSFTIAALCCLPSILMKEQANALIAFFSLPSGLIALVANRFAGLPYVVSLRGGDVPGLVPQLNPLHKLLAPLRRYVLKRAEAVIANSEGLRTLSERADPFPVRLITNGADTGFFRPDPTKRLSQRATNRLSILFVGRFHEQKNLGFLFRQLATLPRDSFDLHLVGDGPQKDALHVLADQLGIAAAITWHGWLSPAALLAVYQSADCLVHPSLYEGMSNVVLEGMACGLPVIASDVFGSNGLVLNGKTGFLFDLLGEPTEFIAAVNRLHDVDLRRQMGERGRERALEFSSWRNVAAQYADLFSTSRVCANS